MAVTLEKLCEIPFFAQLDEAALRDIAAHTHERAFSATEVIIWEGQPCQAVWFIIRGLTRASRLSAEGREQVLAYLGPGEPLNLVPVLDGGPNLATVEAVTDTTLYAMSCEHFWRMAYDHQEVAQAALKSLASEVRRLSDMVEDLALYTVRTRLARFLSAHAEAKRPRKRWTQEEIAASIGTVREMVGRTLRAFSAEGLIRRERGRIVVLDREGLEREGVGG